MLNAEFITHSDKPMDYELITSTDLCFISGYINSNNYTDYLSDYYRHCSKYPTTRGCVAANAMIPD